MFQETSLRFQETSLRFQETDRKFQETDRKFQESDCKFQESIEEAKLRSKETDSRFKETDKKIKEVSRQIGNLGNRLGQFVEEMVRPAVVRLFQSRGLDVHQVMKNVTAYDDAGQFRLEIDLLVINQKTLVAVEVKSNLGQDDVKEHLERLALIKDCFPQYADYQVMGAVAGAVVPEEVGRFAYRQGLFVLAQNGDTMEICNDDRFAPHTW